MRWSLALAVSLMSPLSACVSDVSFECLNDAPMCDILEVTGDQRRLSSGIEITRVAIAQGVHTDLMLDGEPAEPNVPLIAGRDAVVRVFVKPTTDWVPRGVTGRFLLWQDGQVIGAAQGGMRPSLTSDMESLDSTVNIRVPGSMIPGGDLEWSVQLLEAPGADRGRGSSDGAQYPDVDDGGAPIEIRDGGESLRVYLVPIEWNTDGSGQLPITNDVAVEAFRTELYKIFPVAEVEIVVADPMPWDQGVNSLGAWSTLLGAVSELRQERSDISDDQYIYGVFNPTDSGGAGIAGLSSLGQSARDAQSRASIGISRAAGDGAGTMAHEIGHAHGLRHAPCGGAAGPDPDYPHEGASIGSYGYDLTEDLLKGPGTYVDLMSYCGPTWVSDFYYRRMFTRQQGIYEEVLGGNPDAEARTALRPWQTVWMHEGGRVTKGAPHWLDQPPMGEPTVVQLADGTKVDAVFSPFGHVGGGIVYIPVDEAPSRLSIDGGPLLKPALIRPKR
ncbi:MAG: M66 family metalloprotease [Myxococcota bacterium]